MSSYSQLLFFHKLSSGGGLWERFSQTFCKIYWKTPVPDSLFKQSLFFCKKRVKTLVKKRLWHRCFPVNCANFQRTPLFTKHLRWLLQFFLFFQKHVTLKMSILLLWFNIAFTTRRIIEMIHSYSSEELI